MMRRYAEAPVGGESGAGIVLSYGAAHRLATEGDLPELPELEVYRERLEAALAGRRVEAVRVHDPFVLRTVSPAPDDLVSRRLEGVSRRSKFLVLRFEGPVHLAVHLMLAGRLHLKPVDRFRPHRKRTVLSIELDGGLVLEMTEAGTRRRASVHVLGDPSELSRIDRGVEPLGDSLDAHGLGQVLRGRNRRLKTALRDPDLLAGIGNAYSDEILFEARLSPMLLTRALDDERLERLLHAIRETLTAWIGRVRAACPDGLPVKQDVWRRNMAVHGRAGQPCGRCGATICRISFQESETCYCPGCQTEGRGLADRRLSRFGIRRPGG
jgi:formamidopyrimidine-DNA glycosylase